MDNSVAFLAVRTTDTSQTRRSALLLQVIASGWVASTEATREQKMLWRVTCPEQGVTKVPRFEKKWTFGRGRSFGEEMPPSSQPACGAMYRFPGSSTTRGQTGCDLQVRGCAVLERTLSVIGLHPIFAAIQWN